MKGGTEKRVSIFVAVAMVAQGLYAVFPLPDIWPLSNYSMFSRAAPSTAASRYEIHGLAEDGTRTAALDHPRAFSPLDRVRLAKGIDRIVRREDFARRQEERVESVFGYLGFLPAGGEALKDTVRKLLPYGDGGAGVSEEDKEKDLALLLDYLLSRYERNRAAGIHDGPPAGKLGLYRTTWDWTDVPPAEVVPRTELVYSAERGLVGGE